jgi:hypothetical protein
MDTTLSSTFFLTLLMTIGLFFFIRASVKDRTEELQWVTEQPEEAILPELQGYFDRRAYRVKAVDGEHNQVTFEGFVRPSWFLAIFLTLLAAVGMLCLALILSMVIPQGGNVFLGLILLSPVAGWFYWKNSGRMEQVSLQVKSMEGSGNHPTQNQITVTGHRDELAVLKQTLGPQYSQG